MSDKKVRNYNIRASIPTALRAAGVFGTVVALIAVGIGFYVATSKDGFRGREFPGELSENVVGIVNGYQRKEAENGVLKYFVKADIAKTYDDNHQELDNVTLQVFKNGDAKDFDKISANRAVYIPKPDSRDFTIFFAGEVDILTHNNLEVQTDQLNYRSEVQIAKAEEAVTFKRFNISGSSFGAIVDIGRKTLELSSDVEILALGGGDEEFSDLDLERARLRAGYAFIEGNDETIKLKEKVFIALTPDRKSALKQPTEIQSSTALVLLEDREIREIELVGNVFVKQIATQVEPGWLNARARRAKVYVDDSVERVNLFDGVSIETNKGEGKPLLAKSEVGSYFRDSGTFELNESVEIVTERQNGRVRAIASKAVYRQNEGEVSLDGGAEVSQGSELIKGDSIFAKLTGENRLSFAKADNNAYLKQTGNGRVTEVNADVLRAWFSGGERMSKADARGDTRINVLPTDNSEYSRFRLSAPKGIDLGFNGNGSLSGMITLGRTTLHLDAGSKASAAADKTLTADTIKTEFTSSGNELSKAHAIGNAELVVVPKAATAGDYKATVTAPRFDCDFYSGNNARSCTSTKRSKVVRKDIRRDRPDQLLEANSLNSVFDRGTRTVRAFDASGQARFSEGDKNGIAERITYTPGNHLVKLRGGNPTVWDSRARAKAEKIDWNTEEDNSFLTGGVSTTYYNQKQTGNAAPFSNVNSPVFLTAKSARFDHRKRSAVYIGNARAWQDKNYVRGEKIYMEENAGRFFAEGNVSSVLYEAKRTVGGRKNKSPVFVSAGTMIFLRGKRHLRYEKKVDIRQGKDRIVGSAADVFLKPDNSLARTVVNGNVVITQPNRKATGDFAQYDAITEIVILRGNPAVFSDSKAGSSTGKVVTIDLKNNRAVNSGKDSKTGTGRIRSVYKVKGGRLN